MTGPFTPDTMLGIETPDARWEKRLTTQAHIDRIKRPNGRDAILAQQAEVWPDYRGIRPPGIDWGEWSARLMAFLIFLALCAAAGWVYVRGGLR